MWRIRIDRRNRRRRLPPPGDILIDSRDPDIVRAKAASPDHRRAAASPGRGSDGPMTSDVRLERRRSHGDLRDESGRYLMRGRVPWRNAGVVMFQRISNKVI